MAFNLNGFNFNQSVVDSQSRVINTWVDIINRANLGMEAMLERNAHNFPLDLATVEAPSINAFQKPSLVLPTSSQYCMKILLNKHKQTKKISFYGVLKYNEEEKRKINNIYDDKKDMVRHISIQLHVCLS